MAAYLPPPPPPPKHTHTYLLTILKNSDATRGRWTVSYAVSAHHMTAVLGVRSEAIQRDAHTRGGGREDRGDIGITGDGIAGDDAIAQLRSYLCPGESEGSWSS